MVGTNCATTPVQMPSASQYGIPMMSRNSPVAVPLMAASTTRAAT